jgi:hypothetical protein
MKRSAPLKRTPWPRRRDMPLLQALDESRKVFAPAVVPKSTSRAVMVRCDAQAVAVPKDVAARKGKRTPTVAERAWMDAITNLGCIACLIEGRERVPGAVHHILRGGHRIGHMHTICLCDPGHHQNGKAMGLISRHPWKAQFEARYGTEAELLELTKKIVGGGVQP